MIPKGIVGFSDGVDAHLHGDVWNGRDRVGELLVRSDPVPVRDDGHHVESPRGILQDVDDVGVDRALPPVSSMTRTRCRRRDP